MKTIKTLSILAAILCFNVSAFSQSAPQNINFCINYNQEDIDYANSIGSVIEQFNWRLNSSFDNTDTFTLSRAMVFFDTIMDGTPGSNVAYPATKNTITIDSIEIWVSHVNVSGLTDSVIIRILDIQNLTISGNDVTGNLLWGTVITSNTSFSPPPAIAPIKVYPNLALAKGQTFVVKVDYAGPEQDEFFMIAGERDDCFGTCLSEPSIVPFNSFFYLNFITGTGNNLSGFNYLVADCNGDGMGGTPGFCEWFGPQNFFIFPYVTLDTLADTNATIVNFAVDMNGYPNSFNSPYVSGTFNNWCSSCNPLFDPDGDGIYTTSVSITEDTIYYGYQLDQNNVVESFTAADSCAAQYGNFYYRCTVLDEPIKNLTPYCFGTCDISCTSPIAPNNTCFTALPIILGTGPLQCSYINQNTQDATPSTNSLSICDNSPTNLDLWYSFTAPFSGEISFSLGSSLFVSGAIYSTCGGSPVECLGGISNNEIVSGLTPSASYLIQIWTDVANAGPFSFCINEIPALTNDICANAMAIPVVSSSSACNYISQNTADATIEPTSASTCDGNANNKDVWYSFIAPGSGSVTFNIINTSATLEAAIYNSCGSAVLTCLGILSNGETVNNLTPGQNYIIQLWSDDFAAGPFSFCLKTTVPPTNNSCDSASLIPVVGEMDTCIYLQGDLSVASYDPNFIQCNPFDPRPDLWYKFIAPASGSIRVELGTPSGSGFKAALYSSCGSLQLCWEFLDAVNRKTAGGLIPGQAYYLQLWSVSGFYSTFSLCIRENIPPVNDNCSNAIQLTVAALNDSCTYVMQDNSNATDDSSSYSTCNVTPFIKDLWYKFTAPANGRVSFDIVEGSASDFDGALYSSCGGQPISCFTTGPNFYSGLVPGQEYFLQIWTQYYLAGTFSICLQDYIAGCTDPAAPNYDSTATVDDGSCMEGVIFAVNMSTYANPFDTVYVTGNWDSWCTTCNPLSDLDGDGIWTAFVPISASSIQYFYQVDNFADQEYMNPTNSSCAIEFSGPTYRTLFKDETIEVLPPYCWESCDTACVPQVDMTFIVDMSLEPFVDTPLHIIGPWNNFNPAATPLSPIGNNQYAVTIQGLQPGESMKYKFINGNSFNGNEEYISSGPCAAGNLYGDRLFTVSFSNDTIGPDCFNMCGPCPVILSDVTFVVNMAEEQNVASTVSIVSSLNGFQLLPMNSLGAGIYSITFNDLQPGTQVVYKYVNGDSLTSQTGEVVGPGLCESPTLPGFREFMVSSIDETVGPFCFGSCNDCPFYDLLFAYNVPDSLYDAGWTGVNYLFGEFWISVWSTNQLARLDANGSLIDTFNIPGLANVRSFTTDDNFIYAANATGTIYRIDPITRQLAPPHLNTALSIRHSTYDATLDNGNGGFWVGNWDTDINAIDRQGNILSTIPAAVHGLTNMYGSAIDNYSQGQKTLWVFDQGGNNSAAYLVQINTSTGAIIRSHDVIPDIDAVVDVSNISLAGGAFISTTVVPGKIVLGGMLQGIPDAIFGYDYGNTSICNAPENLSSVVNTNSAMLMWDPVPGAQSYTLRGTRLGEDSSTFVSFTVGGNFFNASGLTSATSYYWQVSANCSPIPSEYSDFDTFTTLQAPCGGPQNLTETNITSNSATLNWDPVINSVNYIIRGSEGVYDKTQMAYFTTSSTSLFVSGLNPTTTYFWQVQAACTNSTTPVSIYSAVSDFTTLTTGLKWDNEQAISVYPNPNSGSFKIIIPLADQYNYVSIAIYDATGRRVEYIGNFKGDEIDVSLSQGVYQVVVEMDETIHSKRVVVF